MAQSFTVKTNLDQVLPQLDALTKRAIDLKPLYQDIGEALKIQIDTFFKTGIGADGQPWQQNSFATVQAYIKQRGGYTANGSLNKRGVQLSTSKKVLQGITGDLRRGVYWQATQDALTLGNQTPYAAIHTWGGKFKAWGKTDLIMPARPFMPVDIDGKLYPAAQAIIQRRLNQHLSTLA